MQLGDCVAVMVLVKKVHSSTRQIRGLMQRVHYFGYHQDFFEHTIHVEKVPQNPGMICATNETIISFVSL